MFKTVIRVRAFGANKGRVDYLWLMGSIITNFGVVAIIVIVAINIIIITVIYDNSDQIQIESFCATEVGGGVLFMATVQLKVWQQLPGVGWHNNEAKHNGEAGRGVQYIHKHAKIWLHSRYCILVSACPHILIIPYPSSYPQKL